jgi:hypothetical protein
VENYCVVYTFLNVYRLMPQCAGLIVNIVKASGNCAYHPL